VKHKTSRDLTSGLRKLATASVPTQNLERHWGVIQGVSVDGTAALTIGGSSQTVTGVQTLASYFPVAGDTVLLDVVGSDVVVVGTLGASRGPLGVLPGGYAEVLVSQGPITTEVAIAGLFVTVPVFSNRRIRVSQQTFPGSGSIANQVITANIKEGTTFLMQANTTLSFSGGNQTNHSAVILKPPAGIHTYFLSMSTGSGSFTNAASATFRSWIMAEDIGPA
jgi:hypothetical protein